MPSSPPSATPAKAPDASGLRKEMSTVLLKPPTRQGCGRKCLLFTVCFTCRKCGGKLKIVAYLHDQVAIKQILDYLGLSPPEDPKPPPAVHEILRVPVDEEGREIEAP